MKFRRIKHKNYKSFMIFAHIRNNEYKDLPRRKADYELSNITVY